jgi:hypothetical protein
VAPRAPETGDPRLAAPEAGAGWRDLRVLRREFEDAAQTQCSFHLQPVDGAPLAPLAPFQPGRHFTFSLPPLPPLPQAGAGEDTAPAGAQATLNRRDAPSDRPDRGAYSITVECVLLPAGHALTGMPQLDATATCRASGGGGQQGARDARPNHAAAGRRRMRRIEPRPLGS